MGAILRLTPTTMPTEARARKFLGGLGMPTLLAGSRTDGKVHEPDFAQHGNYRLRCGTLADVAKKHVVIFVHGYNVDADEAMASARTFFAGLKAALKHDGRDLNQFGFIAFTWPGDVGPAWFNDAQSFAQHSGAALYLLVDELVQTHQAKVSLVTHSLGAHVGLRSASILGERLCTGGGKSRFDDVLLLAAAVEDDVFERPEMLEEYHFPESAFGMHRLNMFVSRGDDVLRRAFKLNEFDTALGLAGPESMEPLKSLSQRVSDVIHQHFTFRVHDFSPRSTTIYNPDLLVEDHSGYMRKPAQFNYYVNFLGKDAA